MLLQEITDGPNPKIVVLETRRLRDNKLVLYAQEACFLDVVTELTVFPVPFLLSASSPLCAAQPLELWVRYLQVCVWLGWLSTFLLITLLLAWPGDLLCSRATHCTPRVLHFGSFVCIWWPVAWFAANPGAKSMISGFLKGILHNIFFILYHCWTDVL